MLTELASDTLLAAEVVDDNETIGFIINKKVDKAGLSMCRIPDDCLDPKRYPLFTGWAVMQELINSLKTQAQLPLVKCRST